MCHIIYKEKGVCQLTTAQFSCYSHSARALDKKFFIRDGEQLDVIITHAKFTPYCTQCAETTAQAGTLAELMQRTIKHCTGSVH